MVYKVVINCFIYKYIQHVHGYWNNHFHSAAEKQWANPRLRKVYEFYSSMYGKLENNSVNSAYISGMFKEQLQH